MGRSRSTVSRRRCGHHISVRCLSRGSRFERALGAGLLLLLLLFPLLAPAQGHEVSERTADLSRRHTVRVSDHGLITVTGGKLTTYRRMAERVGLSSEKVQRPMRA